MFDTARMIAIASPHVFHEGQQAELCVYIKFQIAAFASKRFVSDAVSINRRTGDSFDKFDMQIAHSTKGKSG